MSERADDPTEERRWRRVSALLSDLDDEIAQLYAENGIDNLKPVWVREIVRLHARGPMTIAELARSFAISDADSTLSVSLTTAGLGVALLFTGPVSEVLGRP